MQLQGPTTTSRRRPFAFPGCLLRLRGTGSTPIDRVSLIAVESCSLGQGECSHSLEEEDIVTGRLRLRKTLPALAMLALGVGMAACSIAPAGNDEEPSSTQDPATTDRGESVAGTVVHFTAGDVVIKAVIEEDNPTTRSFVAMLPMTLEFSDYGGKEKVATPTGAFDYTDAEGLNAQEGDLFSYMPWGNIGFFYDAEGNTFSNALTRIGSTNDLDQIELLDGEAVTIDIAH
jgi:hypothetical protein